jgi:hypothetical protein
MVSPALKNLNISARPKPAGVTNTLPDFGRAFSIEDLSTAGPLMREIATNVLADYSGDNPFLLSMQMWFGDGELTDKQVVGVLNAIRKETSTKQAGVVGKLIPEGVHTVDLPGGEKFQVVVEGTIAQYVAPSGNKIPFATIEGPRVLLYSKYTNVPKMAKVREDLENLAR